MAAIVTPPGSGVVARRVTARASGRQSRTHAICCGPQCGERVRNWYFSNFWYYLHFLQTKDVMDSLNQLGAKFPQLRLDLCLTPSHAEATDAFSAKWHWILSDKEVQLAGISQLDFGVIHRHAVSDKRWRAENYHPAVPLIYRDFRLRTWIREINQLHQQLLLSWVENIEVTITSIVKRQEAFILSDLLSAVDTLPSTLATLITEYIHGDLFMAAEFSHQ